LVGGQNGPKRTMLSCQTLGRSDPFDRILNGLDLKTQRNTSLLF